MSRPMRWRVVAVSLLALGAFVASAQPCLACSCAPRPPAAMLRAADVAFVGTVRDQGPTGEASTVQTFHVERVFKGDVPATVDLVAEIGSAQVNTCAVLFPVGSPVAVLAHDAGDGAFASDVCSLITVEQLEKIGGTGTAPSAAQPTSEPTTPPPPDDAATPLDEPSRGVPWQSAVAGAAIGVTAIVVVLVLAGRQRRGQEESSPFEDVPPPEDVAPRSPAQDPAEPPPLG